MMYTEIDRESGTEENLTTVGETTKDNLRTTVKSAFGTLGIYSINTILLASVKFK